MTVEARARELLACPFCGGQPKLVTGQRDRGLHPAANRVRYSCTRHDHIVASPWAELGYLGVTHDDPRLIAKAIAAWNTRAALKPDPVAGEVGTLKTLSAEFSRWLDKGPNEQPRYADGVRPFSTGDLKALVQALNRAVVVHQQPPAGGDADVCATCGHRRREHGGTWCFPFVSSEGRVEIGKDDPLYKAFRPSPETVAARDGALREAAAVVDRRRAQISENSTWSRGVIYGLEQAVAAILALVGSEEAADAQ